MRLLKLWCVNWNFMCNFRDIFLDVVAHWMYSLNYNWSLIGVQIFPRPNGRVHFPVFGVVCVNHRFKTRRRHWARACVLL